MSLSRATIDPCLPRTAQPGTSRDVPGNPVVTFLSVLVGVLLMLSLFVSVAWSQEQKTIRLVGFKYPPFYQEQGDTAEGIAIDIAHVLFARLGLTAEIDVYPLKRTLMLLEQGRADGTMILIQTPERSEYLHFTDPVMTVRGLLWSVAGREGGAVDFDKLEELRPYKAGVTQGYSYGHEFDEILATMDVEVANTDYQSYLMLLSRRTDIVPGNEIVAKGLFKKHPELRGKFVHSEQAFIKWDLRIAISKKSPVAALVPEINAVLADMKREGLIDEIVTRYTQ